MNLRGLTILDRNLKILICDDSMLLRKKLTRELESQNCEVIEAAMVKKP